MTRIEEIEQRVIKQDYYGDWSFYGDMDFLLDSIRERDARIAELEEAGSVCAQSSCAGRLPMTSPCGCRPEVGAMCPTAIGMANLYLQYWIMSGFVVTDRRANEARVALMDHIRRARGEEESRD